MIPWGALARSAAPYVICFAVGFGGAWKVQGWRLDAAKAHLATAEANTDRLTAAIAAQNKAIGRYNAEAAVAQREAARARIDAEKVAAEKERLAADLRKWQRRPGEPEIAAARRLLMEAPR